MKFLSTGDSKNDIGRLPKSEGKFFPWAVVLLSALLLFISYIPTYTYGIFFKPIMEDFQWSRATMSGVYTVRSLVCAICVIPIGYWADKYDPRRILLPCLVLIGVSMLAVVWVTNVWEFYLVQGVTIGIGISGAYVCIMSNVAKWHDTNRGLALGITSIGTGLSAIIFPIVASVLINLKQWPYAIFTLGITVLLIGVPISAMIVNPRRAIKYNTSTMKPDGVGYSGSYLPFFQFMRNRTFFSIIMIVFLTSFVFNLILTHLVNYATDIKITPLVAAGMISAVGIASIIGRLGIGAFADKIGTKVDAIICCSLLAFSSLLFISQIPALMWIAAVLFGVGGGGTAPLLPAMMGERVSANQLSRATGIGSTGFYIGAAIGPWLGGFIFDVNKSYLWALILAVAAGIIALIFTLRMPAESNGR
jgi:MFS family permease